MKLSLIIPVYNVEKYLDECINSIVSQVIPDMEVILVDDGSKDNSGKICDDYVEKYNYIKVIHKENGGVSTARNVGISVAQGEYIFFLDSDDILAPNILNKIQEDIKSNFDLYSYQIQKIDENGNMIVDSCIKRTMREGMYQKVNFVREYKKQYNGYLPWSTQNVYKKKILIENNLLYPVGIIIAEDMDFFMNLIKYVSTVGFYYDNIICCRVNRVGSAMTTMSPIGVENIMEITSKHFYEKECVVHELFANAYTANIWKIALIDDEETRQKLSQKLDMKIINSSTTIRYFILKMIFVLLGKEKTVEWIRKRQQKKIADERR